MDTSKSILQKLNDPLFNSNDVTVYLKRDDLIDPIISGNKWRKLSLNIEKAKHKKFNTILTFGGAFSNHIVATAAACKKANLKSIGIIRGENIKNESLKQASKLGMDLHFIDRESYRMKNSKEYHAQLHSQFGSFYTIPEGGANFLGASGCMSIVNEIDVPFDYIVAATGTGTTIAGLIMGIDYSKKVVGIPVLKNGGFLGDDIKTLLYQSYLDSDTVEDRIKLLELKVNYHFGGYAKFSDSLIEFMKAFYKKHAIELDFVYTAKMMYATYNLIQKGFFKPKSTIVCIHTGGLQGNRGLKSRYGIKFP